jgi:Tfp pilus assembly protein PilF
MKPATPEFNRIRQLLSSHRMNSDSIAKFERVLTSGRDSALLRFSLGNEYLKTGDARTAANHFEQAIALDPDYSAAWKLYGRALTECERFDDAQRAYENGIKVAERKGDKQAAKEMAVFAKRLSKQRMPSH